MGHGDNEVVVNHEAAHQSAGEFYNQFQAHKQRLLSDIDQIQNNHQKLQCLEAISDLSLKCRQSRGFLPQYDLETYTNELKNLTDLVNKKAATKKKFLFKTRATSDTHRPTLLPGESLPGESLPGESLPGESLPGESLPGESPISAEPLSCCVLTGNNKVIQQSGLATSLPLKLSNSRSSIFVVETSITSCSINDTHNCIIYIPHVEGPLYISQASKCIIIAHCHQLRLHDSHDCCILLSCSSKRPIIEKSRDLSFGYFPHLLGSGRTDLVKWDDVDDFNWLRRTRSENWNFWNNDTIDWSFLLTSHPCLDHLELVNKLTSL